MQLSPSEAGAADPLADAQAKITAAQRAADKAAGDFDDVQTRYFGLQENIKRTERTIVGLRADSARLVSIVQQRAVIAYESGGQSPLGDILSGSTDALQAGRRAVLVDHANARTQTAISDLRRTTDDLHAREKSLRRQLDEQTTALNELRARQVELQQNLDAATRAAAQLRAQLERERRLNEYVALVRNAQAAARAHTARESHPAAVAMPAPAGSSAGGGGPGQIIGSGSWVCPVQGGVSFTDTYGAPRSGGRTHKGVDMFAPRGTPTVAVLPGQVFFQGDPLGGLAAYVQGDDGNTYYYAHLNDYVGGGRSVAAGEVIGHVGNTGDASDAPPHLHFEIRIGGPNGERINPYLTTRTNC